MPSACATQRMTRIAISGRVLGALFYYAPTSEEARPLLETFRTPEWASQWPWQDPHSLALCGQLSTALDNTTGEPLQAAWQRLFIGPDALPAPPWGSVWLDKESVLFGDSMLALRQWMRTCGIEYQLQQQEPDDHFGTLLMLAAWLAEQGQAQQVDELLAWHLLPWSGRFLELFTEGARHPFYQALGELARQTLAHWQAELLIPVAEKKLYR
ncbi:Tat proofreading chaperone DmsD [Shimwellia blattae]|uniref:Tat proofreading chaperone DmsD n=1 Tax=Shimwellia blattae (strain ATCC 29907 / DSM 4481 / JCM 1650 / NBRC 105725 / CDC 9005-74) TaxID=630626 RepID=I2B9V6_SHIBC|nr:Tat proofreading chaperone DmsD [Shimwellia blattae]AFJ47310.1 twin-arginine leader-binding protein DmsD [Shimwellia blattae DSM 4481 = NBRC 105725]GAB80494.1 twin-arginine leader-binding protein DmsD [Shimwellia blattae DSM 4481 = NBRC 105725]VDY64805.1 Twin-arginine leader-binding protein DmsD [Shimwellia blattae]VEC22904.1 Twin-arginine leader-binding protein DmsD [Shimwellia blattae]